MVPHRMEAKTVMEVTIMKVDLLMTASRVNLCSWWLWCNWECEWGVLLMLLILLEEEEQLEEEELMEELSAS